MEPCMKPRIKLRLRSYMEKIGEEHVHYARSE